MYTDDTNVHYLHSEVTLLVCIEANAPLNDNQHLEGQMKPFERPKLAHGPHFEHPCFK